MVKDGVGVREIRSWPGSKSLGATCIFVLVLPVEQTSSGEKKHGGTICSYNNFAIRLPNGVLSVGAPATSSLVC